MKKIYILLLLALFPLMGWAQEPEYNDRDTANSMIQIGIIGDVVSGYDMTVTEYEGFSGRFRWYHADKNGTPVRQIVVLRQKWPNVPEDIQAGDGGYMLAAVTSKEYAELTARDLIWGECWEVCYPEGIYSWNKDTVPNVPGYEIVCYELGKERYPSFGTEQREATRELMSYRDTINGEEKSYMTVAANLTTGSADYTPSKTGGKYETRWMLCDDREASYWFTKWEKHQAEKEEETLYMDAYQEWLDSTSGNEELRMKNPLRGVKANTLCLYYPRHSALTPLTPTNSSNSSGKLNAIIGNVLSGYKTVALPFDGQSTRFRWFWTDSTKTIGRQIVVLRMPSPHVPNSLTAAGGGFTLAALDVDDYLYFKEHGAIWGECWEITPSRGAFEFVCLKAGSEWMAENDARYLENSRELLFYTWNNGKKDIYVPTVGANRTKGKSDYSPLYFPVRMLKTDVKEVKP